MSRFIMTFRNEDEIVLNQKYVSTEDDEKT